MSETSFFHHQDDVRRMLNLDHETVLRLRKAVYGLVNAPKKWWDRLKKSLIEHGFTSCALDPCAFVLRMSGKIRVHVDDVIGGEDETFDRIMTAVRKEFDFGAWDVGNFRFNGQISQMPNEKSCLTWNSTSMSLNKSTCPRPTKPSLNVS